MRQYSSSLWLSLGSTPYMLYTVLCHSGLSTFLQVGIVHSELEFRVEQNCRMGQKALVP